MRTLIKIVTYGGLALIGLTLLVFLARDPLRDALGHMVSSRLSQALDGSLEIGKLRGSLITSVVLQDMVLRDQHGVIGQLDEVRLVYNPLSLLKGKLTVYGVDIVRPRVTLVQRADGTWNMTHILPSPQPNNAPLSPSVPGFPLAITVMRLQIHDGQVALHTPSLPGVHHLEAVQIQLSATMDRAGLHVEVQQGTAHARPADVTIRSLRGALQILPGVLRVDALHLKTDQTVLTINGVLPGGAHPARVKVHMHPLEVTELGRLLHDDALHGRVRLTLEAEGPPEALRLHALLTTAGGRVELQGRVNTVHTPLRYRGTLDMTGLNLAMLWHQPALQSAINLRLHLDGTGHTLEEMRGQVRLDIRPSHVGQITLRPSRIDVEIHRHRFRVRHFRLDTSVAQMVMQGTVDLAGRSDLQYQGSADLSQLRPLLGIEAVGGHLRLQGQVAGAFTALGAHGTLQMTDVLYRTNRLRSLQLTYEGTQLGTRPRLQVRCLARQVSIGALPLEQLGLLATYDTQTPQVRFTATVRQSADSGGRVKGSVTLDERGSQGVLEELRLQVAKRTWRNTTPLKIAFGAGRVHLTTFRLAHADETLELAGGIDGQQLQNLRLVARRMHVAALRRLVALPDFVTGQATVHMQLRGTLTQPILQAALRWQPTSQQPSPPVSLHTTLTYEHQYLQSRLRLRQANHEALSVVLQLPIDLALTASPLAQRLRDAPLEVQVAFKRPQLTMLHRWFPSLPALSGTLQGILRLRGTYAAVTLDTRLQLDRFGVQEVIERLSMPLHLTALLINAPSLAELQRDIQRGAIRLRLQTLKMRVPTLHGWLAGDAPQPVHMQNLQLRAEGEWSPAGIHATLHHVRLQTEAFGLPRADIALTARLTPDQVDLTHLRIRLPRSVLQGHGTLRLADRHLQVDVAIPRLQLDELLSGFPAALPSALQGTLKVQGNLQAPQLVARVQYAGAQLTAHVALQWPQRLPRYTATLQLDALPLARLLPGARGQMRARLRLQGVGLEAEHRHVQLDLQGASHDCSLAPGLTMRLQARLDGTAVQLKALQLQSSLADLMARGSLSAARRVTMRYTLRLKDLRPLQALLGTELQARGDISGAIAGQLGRVQSHGTISVEPWSVAHLRGRQLHATFVAAGMPERPRATIKMRLVDLQAAALPATSVTLAGSYQGAQGTLHMAVTAGPYTGTQLAGTLDLQQGQQLTLTRFRVQAHSLVWENEGPIAAQRDARGVIRIRRFVLRSGKQELRAGGKLDAQGSVAVQVHLRRILIRPSVQAILPEAVVPQGQLTLDVTVTGPLTQPRVAGKLLVTSLRWQRQRFGEVHAVMDRTGRTVHTDVRWQDQDQELLHIQGTVGLGSEGALALQVVAPGIDLQRLALVSAAILDSAGRLQLDMQVRGTLKQPQLYGFLAVRDGAVQLAVTGERYTDIQAQLAFAGHRVDIHHFHLGSRTGALQLSGWVERTGLALRQLEVALQADHFTAIHTPRLEAVVSAAVTVRGSPQAMRVTGKITVPRARLRLSGRLGGGPAEVKPRELTVAGVYGSDSGAAPSAAGSGQRSPRPVPFPFLQTDLTIDLPRNAWLQGPGTAVEIQGMLRLTKALQQPLLLHGTIGTVRGFVSYFGKKFVVQQGKITFPGSEELNPFLDVTVTHAVSDYVVTIQVEGTARTPQLTLSSTPELEQADIVSLLVIGKTTDRLTISEQNSLSGRVQQVIGGVAAGQLEQILGQPLGLDTVEVEAGDKLGTGRVGVGRYITQDLFLSYERQFGGKGGNRVGVEYSINRRLKLKGSSSDTGESALDIIWRLDY